MFSSSSNNGYNPFDPFITNQTTPPPPSFELNGNPNSIHEDHQSPFLHYPEAFLDNNNLLMSQLLSQQQLLGSCCNLSANSRIHSNNNNGIVSPRKGTKKATSSNNADQKKKKKKISSCDSDGDGATAKPTVPRKRAGKKDRHSKIYTAQGPRDRRMRLSLQIARKFFDLQDMLGFDRASKTIEWLFSKSKASIKELKDSLPDAKENPKNLNSENIVASRGKREEGWEMDESLKRFTKNPESTFKAKELRDNARARARERTMKKMEMRSGLGVSKPGSDHQDTNSNDLDQIGSSSSCSQEIIKTSTKMRAGKEEEEEGEEFSNVYFLEHQMDSMINIEKFLGIASNSSSSSIFNYSNNVRDAVRLNSEESYADLSGNWNISSDGVQSSFCAIRVAKGSTGNVLIQNPNAILATDLIPMASSTNKKPNSISPFMNHSKDQGRNPSPVFIYDCLKS